MYTNFLQNINDFLTTNKIKFNQLNTLKYLTTIISYGKCVKDIKSRIDDPKATFQ